HAGRQIVSRQIEEVLPSGQVAGGQHLPQRPPLQVAQASGDGAFLRQQQAQGGVAAEGVGVGFDLQGGQRGPGGGRDRRGRLRQRLLAGGRGEGLVGFVLRPRAIGGEQAAGVLPQRLAGGEGHVPVAQPDVGADERFVQHLDIRSEDLDLDARLSRQIAGDGDAAPGEDELVGGEVGGGEGEGI
ncbi:hypothetical protein RZS08_08855, partial [Arthrospira platensis SPKY1]|nr:hypothetical protein [Arthrospira platensis SPKY1]